MQNINFEKTQKRLDALKWPIRFRNHLTGTLTLKQVILMFFSERRETIYDNGKRQSYDAALRSIEDFYRILKYYFPERSFSLEGVEKMIYPAVSKSIGRSYCTTVRRQVHEVPFHWSENFSRFASKAELPKN